MTAIRHPLAVTLEIAARYGCTVRTDLPPLPTGWQVTKAKMGEKQKRDMNNCQKIRAAMVKLMDFNNVELTEASGCVHTTVRRVIQFHLKAGNVIVTRKMRPPTTRARYRWTGTDEQTTTKEETK